MTELNRTKNHQHQLMNTGTNWGGLGLGTSFGAQAQPTLGSAGLNLFGNSSLAPKPTLLFGSANQSATQPSASGGLFENSGTNASSGLGANTQSTPSGGLFGSNSTSGGLLGNTATGGLFGNTAKPASSLGGSLGTLGGLFGQSAPSLGGLFSTTKPATGLGASSLAQNGTSTGLFGSSGASAGGLFGGSNTGGGLFGNSASGQSSTQPATVTSGGLFGSAGSSGPNPSSSVSGANPYNSDSVLTSILNSENNMPLSITSSLFKLDERPTQTSSRAEPITKTSAKRGTLLGRLAQTFNLFRSSLPATKSLSSRSVEGIFTQSPYVDRDFKRKVTHYLVTKPKSSRLDVDKMLQRIGDVRKLVIKSKPSKFHQIDAEKVFARKRRRIITSTQDLDDLDDFDSDGAETKKIDASETPKQDDAPVETSPKPPTRDGYFCSPPIETLVNMSAKQLAAVPNFIVGRVDYGQIAYDFPVDLSDIFCTNNFDTELVAKHMFGKLFKIEERVVRVYDDPDLKSLPMGKGLNFPATVTVKTPPKKNHTIARHLELLQNITGMEFVTYDPISFNWTFKVKHFSVWGLIDDSEDEDKTEEMIRLRKMKAKQDEEEAAHTLEYSRLYENELYQNELKKQQIQLQTSGIPGGWDETIVKPSEGPLSIRQDLLQTEINKEINIYKENESALVIAANASDITADSDADEQASDNQMDLAAERFFPPGDVHDYDYLKQIVSVIPPDADMEELVDEKAYEPDIEDENLFNKFQKGSSVQTSRDWVLQLELANKIDSVLAPMLTEPRKPQSALYAISDILFSGTDKFTADLNQASTPKGGSREPPVFIPLSTIADKDQMSRSIGDILSQTTHIPRANKLQKLDFASSLSFKTLAALFKNDADFEFLELASLLFDKLELKSLSRYLDVEESDHVLMARLELLERRKALSRWLAKFNEGVLEQPGSDPLEQILASIYCGECTSAIETAISSKNNHLAVLLTLLDSNDASVHRIASDQLEHWKVSKELDLIPVAVQKVHKILAGDFSFFDSDLPFSVVLGLHINYGDSGEQLEDVFSTLSELNTLLGETLRIYTAYKRDTFEAAATAITESTLSKKLKWILYHVLARLSSKSVASAQDALGQAFGEELLSNGLWKASVFVFSTISSDDTALKLTRRAVMENVVQVSKDCESNDKHLTDTLHVPKTLLYEALSIERKRKNDLWGCAEALVIAELWEETHDLICRELGPAVVLEEDNLLKTRFRALSGSFPDEGRIIPNWNQGAGLFTKYLDVVSEFEQQGLAAKSDIEFVVENLPLMQYETTFAAKAAFKIMSKAIGDIAIESSDHLAGLLEKIKALMVGENERAYFTHRLATLGE